MKIEIVAKKIYKKLGYFYYLVDSEPIYNDIQITKLFEISYDEYKEKISHFCKIVCSGTQTIFVECDLSIDEMTKKFKEEFSSELTLLKLKDSIQF